MLQHKQYDMQINIRIRTKARLSYTSKRTCAVCIGILAGKYKTFVAEEHFITSKETINDSRDIQECKHSFVYDTALIGTPKPLENQSKLPTSFPGMLAPSILM